jgi:anti-sigma factor ChrR (cupin superfamily)
MNRPHTGTSHGSSGGAWRRPHTRLDAALELAALNHARGALSASEAADYAAHLEHCEVCSALADEQRHVDETMAAIVDGGRLAPSAEVWDLVEERVAKSQTRREREHASRQPVKNAGNAIQTWKTWDGVDSSAIGAPGLSLVAMDQGAFEPTAIPGITTRRLAVDREARRVSMLVRMEPNTAYPPHRHGGAEECYVVAGDLWVGDTRMRAGDFQRAEAGSVHPVQSTDGGCLLLITSSLDDELIETA